MQTTDMRRLPFPDRSFDIIVSCAAIHNISRAEGRGQAVAEMARVLKPGGRVVINDIRNLRDYEKVLVAHECPVRQVGSIWTSIPVTLITWGALRPGTLVGQKG